MPATCLLPWLELPESKVTVACTDVVRYGLPHK